MRTLTFVITLLLLAHSARAADAPVENLPREVAINGVEFVLIPAGWFRYSVTTGHLGLQPKGAPLFREFRVWLDSYYLAKYEARASDFARFLNSGPEPAAMMEAQERDRALAYPEGEPPPDPACTVGRDAAGVYRIMDSGHDLPATNLSWNMANTFAQWMGFRLPSEAEWEKGARGPDPDRRVWPWGDDYPDDTYGAFARPSECDPAPVAAHPKGRSPYGIYNLAGNVEEPVADWYNRNFDKSLGDGVQVPPPATEATPFPGEMPYKIVKGGRWQLNGEQQIIARRSLTRPNASGNPMGTRFAVDAEIVRKHLEDGAATILEHK